MIAFCTTMLGACGSPSLDSSSLGSSSLDSSSLGGRVPVDNSSADRVQTQRTQTQRTQTQRAKPQIVYGAPLHVGVLEELEWRYLMPTPKTPLPPLAPPPIASRGVLITVDVAAPIRTVTPRGMSARAIESVLGSPWRRRIEGGAHLWQYQTESCMLTLYFYQGAPASGTTLFERLSVRWSTIAPRRTARLLAEIVAPRPVDEVKKARCEALSYQDFKAVAEAKNP